jgi:hypothetical protein
LLIEKVSRSGLTTLIASFSAFALIDEFKQNKTQLLSLHPSKVKMKYLASSSEATILNSPPKLPVLESWY